MVRVTSGPECHLLDTAFLHPNPDEFIYMMLCYPATNLTNMVL
jgi:hypothetical protein